MDKWERKHRLYMQRLERMIKAIYETAAREAASISSAVGDIGDDLFNFDRYPITKARVDELFNTMQQNMEVAIVDGINAQWALANEKNDDLCTRILGNTYDNLTPQQRQRYFTNNEGARLAFLARKNKGLSLSDQVWRYTNAYRQEIEMGLDMGIRDGLSADELSRELRSYLKYPDKLFRRVRNEHGQLVLSKAAQAFHPGRGVYRSSYMNARRLAATETNIAYRTADYERYNRLDFVVGIEVHLSDTNHNCKGVPAGSFVDICDTFAGKYPKQFKFVGWHPHCRCYVTSILKTDQEIAADNERILRGEEPLEGSVNSVDILPEDFTKWAKAHKDIKGSPYWLKDNFNNGKFSDGVSWENKIDVNKPRSVAELSAIRHRKRTPEQIASIKQRWKEHKEKHELIKKRANNVLSVAQDYSEVDYDTLQQLINENNLTKLPEVTKEVARAIADMKKQEAALSDLIPDIHNWHKQFSIAELQQAHTAVSNTLKDWLTKHGYTDLDAAPLTHTKAKLEQEIGALGSKKHKTWKVANSAYSNMLDKVQDKIDWEEITQNAAELKKFKTTSKAYKDVLASLANATAAKDKTAAQKAIAEATAKKDAIETQRQKKTTKQTTSSIIGNTEKQFGHSDNWYYGMTENEMCQMVMDMCHCDRKTAMEFADAVHSFTHKHDWEIRHYQMGEKFKSKYGHTMEEIKRKAKFLEEFITKSPKWAGGTTYRGIAVSRNDYEEILKSLKAGNADILRGTASWSSDESVAKDFAIGSASELRKKRVRDIVKIVFECDKQAKATSIKHLSEYPGEMEVIAALLSRYTLVRERRVGDTIYLKVSAYI